MLAYIKMAMGIWNAYKMWISIAAIGGVVLSILVFYGNCRANAVRLDEAHVTIKMLQDDLVATRAAVRARDQRISAMNERHRLEIKAADKLLKESRLAAEALRTEKDMIEEQLEITRFELLEAIRDDEDFADWVDYTVPIAGWRLLQQAAEGTSP